MVRGDGCGSVAGQTVDVETGRPETQGTLPKPCLLLLVLTARVNIVFILLI